MDLENLKHSSRKRTLQLGSNTCNFCILHMFFWTLSIAIPITYNVFLFNFFCFLSLIRVLFSFHRLPLILKPILTSRLKIWLLFFISLLLLLLTSLLSFLILSSCIIPDFSWRRIVSREGVSQSDSELLEEIFFSWLN